MEGRESWAGFSPQEEESGKDVAEDAKAEYGDLSGLFQAEVNDETLVRVEGQLADLRRLIEKHGKLSGELKADPGVEPYLDECAANIEAALTGLEIGGKKINLRELSEETDPKEIYNEAAYLLNEYKDMFMGGGERTPEI